MKNYSQVQLFFARQSRAIAGAAFCLAALLAAALCGGFSGTVNRQVKTADALAGKWGGDIVWNSASGRDYSRTLHTALFFLPHGVVGTVITFPAGALGGSGTYTLQEGRLTIHCTGLTVTGHPVPLSVFDKAPWFHGMAVYSVVSDGTNLTLTPLTAGPVPAPCYPLLLSPKPLVFSRVEHPMEKSADPAPRE